MRNLKIKTLFALLLALTSVPASASTPSVSLALTLTGTVSSSCTFSVNSVSAVTGPTPSATSVTLGLSAASETPANGAVVITCNDAAGYLLTASSLNNGSLKNGANLLAYKLDVDTQTPLALTTTAQTVLAKASLPTPETAQSHALRVTYTAGVPSVVSGTYADTVTFTLVGN